MVILIELYVLFLNALYTIFKIFPIKKNKIFFLSRQTNNPSIDFRMMIREIRKNYPNYTISVLTKRVEKDFLSVISILIPIRQLYHLATAEICIIDGYNISISVLKHKKTLKIVQIWHSLAAIKKFGYQSLNSKKDIQLSKYLRMHKNYDLIISGSKEMAKYFSKAFGYSLSSFVSIGLPRIDYLLDKKEYNSHKIYNKYHVFMKKKNILYVPTFRNNNHYEIDKLINSIDTKKYNLIIKLHPNIKVNVDNSNVFWCSEFTSLQLLSVADYVITDYSAISIEAAVLDIPIFLYVYDLDEYRENPGINIDLNLDFGKYVFENPAVLYKELNKDNYDYNVLKKYKSKYLMYVDGKITERLVKYILDRKY